VRTSWGHGTHVSGIIAADTNNDIGGLRPAKTDRILFDRIQRRGVVVAAMGNERDLGVGLMAMPRTRITDPARVVAIRRAVWLERSRSGLPVKQFWLQAMDG
jgi:hypothetical protein